MTYLTTLIAIILRNRSSSSDNQTDHNTGRHISNPYKDNELHKRHTETNSSKPDLVNKIEDITNTKKEDEDTIHTDLSDLNISRDDSYFWWGNPHAEIIQIHINDRQQTTINFGKISNLCNTGICLSSVSHNKIIPIG